MSKGEKSLLFFIHLWYIYRPMAKSFKCGVCKQQKSDVIRFQCVTHRAICKEHVTFFENCRECGRGVIAYEYNPKNSRWEKQKQQDLLRR